MTIREPRDATNLAELYDQDVMPWSRVAAALGSGSLGPETACFLGTVRPDGRPHAAGIGVAECDGDVHFETGPRTRKARNLAANAACTLSMRLDGVDVVLEGEARRVTDPEALRRVAAAVARVSARAAHGVRRRPEATAQRHPLRLLISPRNAKTPRMCRAFVPWAILGSNQ